MASATPALYWDLAANHCLTRDDMEKREWECACVCEKESIEDKKQKINATLVLMQCDVDGTVWWRWVERINRNLNVYYDCIKNWNETTRNEIYLQQEFKNKNKKKKINDLY